jgi:hypothetical protein
MKLEKCVDCEKPAVFKFEGITKDDDYSDFACDDHYSARYRGAYAYAHIKGVSVAVKFNEEGFKHD